MSSYRLVVKTKRDRSIASEMAAMLFDAPLPTLRLTGDGEWRGPHTDTHFVRHACAVEGRTPATAISTAVVHKMLIVEYERARSRADVYRWLREHGGQDVERHLSTISTDRSELLRPGDSLIIGYEPRRSRTRIAWGGQRELDLDGDDVMRGIWGFYFDSVEVPDFKHQLVRWP